LWIGINVSTERENYVIDRWRSLMANVPFGKKEIEDLARKLKTLQPFLNEKERALLLAIFRAAIVHAQGPAAVAEEGGAALPAAIRIQEREVGAERQATLADLQQQLGNAYTPGGDIDSVTIGETTFRIAGTGWPPPPPPPPPPGGEPGDGG
jgi:hypothetical protein